MFLWGSFACLAFQIHVPSVRGISAGICLRCIFLLHHLGLVVTNVGSSRRSLASRCLSSSKLGYQSSWTLFANAYSGTGEFHWFDPGWCRVREGPLSPFGASWYAKKLSNGWESAELGHLIESTRSRSVTWARQHLQHRKQRAKEEEKECGPCCDLMLKGMEGRSVKDSAMLVVRNQVLQYMFVHGLLCCKRSAIFKFNCVWGLLPMAGQRTSMLRSHGGALRPPAPRI